jgi:hypothetical protein
VEVDREVGRLGQHPGPRVEAVDRDVQVHGLDQRDQRRQPGRSGEGQNAVGECGTQAAQCGNAGGQVADPERAQHEDHG